MSVKADSIHSDDAGQPEAIMRLKAVAGATDDQVRQLIRDMVAARAQLMPAKAAA